MRHTYRVYFTDGNQRLLEADGMYALIAHLCFIENYNETDFYKIEEVEQ